MKRIGEFIKNTISNRRRMILVSVIGIALILLAVGGIEVYRTLYKPQDLFKTSTMDPAALNTQSSTPAPTPASASTTPSTSPTVLPTIQPTPDITKDNKIVNILLIGIDRNQTGGKGSGPDVHSDVMMVVAVNFKEKKVDLISLPRDTFIHAPEIMNGVYKLNASFNVGGGFEAKNGGGFLKVCEAAKYMLGGIPVDYYYAMDFSAMVNIVDAIGGVDYEVENRAYSRNNKAGKQHMDGQDVLFYMRTRKVGPERDDKNRVERQKKMLTAIFNQLIKKGKLSVVPELINAANSGIFTNTTLQQTLALVNFAKTYDIGKIGMHSMSGLNKIEAGWYYCFTDQKARQVLIKQVYGIDVPQQVHCSLKYAVWLQNYGFSAIQYLKTAKQLLDDASAIKTEFTAEQQQAYDALTASYAAMQSAYDRASITFGGADNSKMVKAKKTLKPNTDKLAKLLKYKERLKWYYNKYYWLDTGINEVPVDFR